MTVTRYHSDHYYFPARRGVGWGGGEVVEIWNSTGPVVLRLPFSLKPSFIMLIGV